MLLAQGLAIFYFLLLLLLDVHLGDRHGTVEGADHLSRVTKVIFKVYLLCCTRRDERRYNGYTGEQLFGPRGSLLWSCSLVGGINLLQKLYNLPLVRIRYLSRRID